MTGKGELMQRKADHLRIVAQEDVAHGGSTLLEDVELVHNALPEQALADIDLNTQFFGHQLSAPLMITSMSGGADEGGRLNADLARVAGRLNIGFAVGSQLAMLRYPERKPDFAVRREMQRGGVLLANLGAQQLREYGVSAARGLIEEIDAAGICIHLNAAHELAQDGGERDFGSLLHVIAELQQELGERVLIKETGAGLSSGVLKQLYGLEIKYIDVAGAGGTSWTKVESYRGADPAAKQVAETFSDWGIPTAVSTITANRLAGEQATIIGSGGIMTGLDAAKALACGADLAGLARAVFLAWRAGGESGAEDYLKRVINDMRAAMLLTGSQTPQQLKTAPRVYSSRLASWLASQV